MKLMTLARAVLLLTTARAAAAGAPLAYSLSDYPTSFEQFSYAAAKRDTSISGQPISLAGVIYPKGMGAHAISDLRWTLAPGAGCSRFQSDVGVDDYAGTGGFVVFQVFGDGALLYDSGAINGDSATKKIDVDITGKSVLKLAVGDGGDNIFSDHADWAGAKVLCLAPPDGSAPPIGTPSSPKAFAFVSGTGGTSTKILKISATSLPNPTQLDPYSATLAAAGGQTPYYWTVISGALPPGLSLSAGGQLSGTPTTAGTYAFTVQAADSGLSKQTASSARSLIVSAAPLGCAQIGSEAFFGCYYDNMDFTSLVLTRTDAQVAFDWSMGSPDPKVAADTFSTRWQGNFTLAAATYEFTATADDGVRLYVDGVLLIDRWIDQGPTTYKATKALTPGSHLIKLEYYENGGGATAKLSWVALVPPDASAPTVSITSPTAGASVVGAITVTATASDNVAVAGVQFKLDGAALGAEATLAPYAATWNTSYSLNGTHVLTAVARDAAGNTTTSAAVTVTVANPIVPPGDGCAANGFGADFYVALNGSDSWSGTADAPCAAAADGPFATLARARDAVRALKAANPSRTKPILVYVRGGTYYQPQALTFGAADSGTSALSISYSAYPGETPIISGGKRITGFAQTAPGVWTVTLPEARNRTWPFMQLFVDGVRKYRPRLPRGDAVFRIAGTGRGGVNRFVYNPADINPGWTNFNQIEALVWHAWTASRQELIGTTADAVEGDDTSVYPMLVTLSGQPNENLSKGKAYVLENVKDAIIDGEWYLDKVTGELIYLTSANPNSSVVIAPKLEQIMVVSGGAGTVSNLTFSGLTFSHTHWDFRATEGYRSAIQAEVHPTVKAAVLVEAANTIVFKGCEFSHVGTYSLEFGRAAKYNRVENSTFIDLGAGGVRIGSFDYTWPSDDAQVASYNTVTNSAFTRGGRMLPGGVGIVIGHSHDNQLDHNDIQDFYYTGISAGWNWTMGNNDPPLTPAHDNLIEYNHVWNIGQGVMADLGGIYIAGNQPGTIVRFNRVHDVTGGRRCGSLDYCYSGAGIYLDNLVSNMVVTKNLVYNEYGVDAFFSHEGEFNQVTNNIFVAGGSSFMRSHDSLRTNTSGSFRSNIFVSGGVFNSYRWGDGAYYSIDDNIYYKKGALGGREFSLDPTAEPPTYTDWTGWIAGDWRDANSLLANPLFIDEANGNYLLQANSPAFGLGRQGRTIGFQQLPISQMGRQGMQGPSPLQITSGPAPNGVLAQAYGAFLSAAGGTAPYAWTVVSGALAPGLALSGAQISGTPTTAGTYTFTIQAADSSSPNKQTALSNQSIVVASAPQTPACNQTGTETFFGCYYDNMDLTNLLVTRADAQISFNWGLGSPDPKIGSETFSALWQGNFTFSAGNYEFTATADDGVRLFVDGAVLIDRWVDQGPTTYKATKTLSSGAHLIKMEYYENGGGATASLNWAGAAAPDTTAPTVSITAPSGGATMTGTVNVTAAAADNVGVAGVQFKLDASNLGTEDQTAPYTLPWNTTGAANGAHALTAVVRDAAGNTATSAAVPLTVSNPTTPTVDCKPGAVQPNGASADFFVAPNGNDAWTGMIDTTYCNAADGPFATMARARDAVLALKNASPGRSSPIKVFFRGGAYYLQTIAFDPQHSGTAAMPIIYAAYPNESPVISAGRPLTGFTQLSATRWQATIPDVGFAFSQLVVDGVRKTRVRMPKTGYYTVASGASQTQLKYNVAQVNPSPTVWTNPNQAEMRNYDKWAEAHLLVQSVDTANQIFTFTGSKALGPMYGGQRYVIENVKEALDDSIPGEWHLNKATGEVTYIAAAGQDLRTSTVVYPRFEYVVKINGSSDLVFDGLTFADTNWAIPATGFSDFQAGQSPAVKAGITVDGGRNIVFKNCGIKNAGATAIKFGAGTKYSRIENCDIAAPGIAGIQLGDVDRSADDQAAASNNVATNNSIHGGGRIMAEGIGIMIGISHNNLVDHNDVDDFYYSGINSGFSWNMTPTAAHDNIIEYNHISNVGQGVLSDLAGIYTLGAQYGTVLRGNKIHDVKFAEYGGWGIYLDEGSSGILVEKNLIYRTQSESFMFHPTAMGAETNVQVLGNIFAYGGLAGMQKNPENGGGQLTIRNNLVYTNSRPATAGYWFDIGSRVDLNLYYDESGAALIFNVDDQARWASQTQNDWQAGGRDLFGRFGADPLFADPGNNNFYVQPGSPAFAVGFQQLPFSEMGRR